MEKAKQDGYDIEVAETEETLRAKVFGVCRTYCLQVWNEALNQVGVEASSTLWGAENIYYPPAIRVSSSSGSKAKIAPKESDPGKHVPAKALPSPISPPKVVQQAKAAEKEKEMAKEVALEITKPLIIPKDSLK